MEPHPIWKLLGVAFETVDEHPRQFNILFRYFSIDFSLNVLIKFVLNKEKCILLRSSFYRDECFPDIDLL